MPWAIALQQLRAGGAGRGPTPAEMNNRVIVTRPAREAAHWVAALQAARGHAAQALPLIAIWPPAPTPMRAPPSPGPGPARQLPCRHVCQRQRSGLHFFEQNTALALTEQAPSAIKTRAWAPGPGTPSRCTAARGGAASLHRQPGARCNAVRLGIPVAAGGDTGARRRPHSHRARHRSGAEPGPGIGRDWLARQIEQAGATVEFVVAYTRGAPRLTPEQTTLAHAAAGDGSWWLLSSSEALAHLASAAPGLALHTARALATHPRIAQAARAAGFGSVHECRPALDDVVASIESAA